MRKGRAGNITDKEFKSYRDLESQVHVKQMAPEITTEHRYGI
jgi:hypothetical protein